MSDTKKDMFTTKKIAILVIAGILSVMAYLMGVPFDMSMFVEQAEEAIEVSVDAPLEVEADEPKGDANEAHPAADEDAEEPTADEEEPKEEEPAVEADETPSEE